MKGITTVTPLVAMITTPAGEEITEASQLKADSEYKIILKGDGADFIRIKYGHIFEILESPSYGGAPLNEFVYKIKTSPDFADQIYINVVPLHKGDIEFIRERSQVFFLPG